MPHLPRPPLPERGALTFVERYLARDMWASGTGAIADGMPFVIRFRTPVLEGREAFGYRRRLVVLWAYADEDTGAMPDHDTSEAMKVFEDRLVEAWEQDATAVLTAVLTLDGARQWLFYTGDVDACVRRVNEMPQEAEPYPIELTTEEDPDWEYLRQEILGGIDYEAEQEQWRREFEASQG